MNGLLELVTGLSPLGQSAVVGIGGFAGLLVLVVVWRSVRAVARAAGAAGRRAAGVRAPAGLRKQAPYLWVAVLAVAGQATAAVEKLDLHGPAIGAAVVIAVGIEGVAVRVSYLALQRSRLGERALGYWIASVVLAAVAVSINLFGHSSWYARIAFGLFSAAGYLMWLLEARTQLRDAWDPDGAIRLAIPAFGLLKQFEGDAKVIGRARLIAQLQAEADPDATGLGPLALLRAARAELADEHRRELITEGIRRRGVAAGMTDVDVAIALVGFDQPAVTAAIIASADNEGLAKLIGRSIRPERFAAPNQTGPVVPVVPETGADLPRRPVAAGSVPEVPVADDEVIAEFLAQLALVPETQEPGSPARTTGPEPDANQKEPVVRVVPPIRQKVRGLTGSREVELDQALVDVAVKAAAELAEAGQKMTRRALENQLRTIYDTPVATSKANALLAYLRDHTEPAGDMERKNA